MSRTRAKPFIPPQKLKPPIKLMPLPLMCQMALAPKTQV